MDRDGWTRDFVASGGSLQWQSGFTRMRRAERLVRLGGRNCWSWSGKERYKPKRQCAKTIRLGRLLAKSMGYGKQQAVPESSFDAPFARHRSANRLRIAVRAIEMFLKPWGGW